MGIQCISYETEVVLYNNSNTYKIPNNIFYTKEFHHCLIHELHPFLYSESKYSIYDDSEKHHFVSHDPNMSMELI